MRAIAVAMVMVWGAGGAWAQRAADAPSRGANDDERPAPKGFSHKKQFELHLAGGVGYRAIFTYDEEYCGKLKDDGTNATPCLGRSPFAFDVGVGYGVLDALEVFVEMRLGVERDFRAAPNKDGPRVKRFAPGLKLYLGDLGPTTKFFSTLQVPIDFTSRDELDKNDVGIRNINGIQLDPHNTFGLFLFFGEQVSWRRWLQFEIEAGLGAQVRFP